MSTIIETRRLIIRKAKPVNSDIELFYNLWNNPRVMTNVGFPHGLKISREDLKSEIEKSGASEYNALLIVALKETGELIGECKLGRPNDDKIAETDVKLLPEYWGNKYGVEIKRALVDYLFEHTDCTAIKASPNVNNAASIKMQESVGGVRVGEGVHKFPEKMRDFTCDVHYYEYLVYRK